MAHIAGEIGDINPKSDERRVLEALEKLDDSYYIIHSLRTITVNNQTVDEAESDFVIFNAKYGILFIEEKAGKVTRNNEGKWFYASGDPMGNDPFDQAFSGMYKFKSKLEKNFPHLKPYIRKCKFMPAVWFPAYSKSEINEQNLGSNVSKELILTKEAMVNPQVEIENMMQELQKTHIIYQVREVTAKGYSHDLSEKESMYLFENAICPNFGIVAATFDSDFQEKIYIRLLKEQCTVLDFLVEQRTAAINGAAGTGKTLIAFERAQRIAAYDKVLFLCYNKNLKEYLQQKAQKLGVNNIDFYTIDGFSCKYAQSQDPNYVKAKVVMDSEIKKGIFPYKHIIVDEGQDFGKDDIINSKILDTLVNYVNSKEECSFFIFYDKNQMIQSNSLPAYIENVDSKLTLYKNCRNTKRIASASLNFLNKKENTYHLASDGIEPQIYFYETETQLKGMLNTLILKLNQVDPMKNNRVILTPKSYLPLSSNHSDILEFVNENSEFVVNGTIKTKCYTCKTFKGLEEDNVIIIDIDESIFGNEKLELYVGSSRAKKQLFLFFKLNRTKITKLLNDIKDYNHLPTPELSFASYLKCKYRKN